MGREWTGRDDRRLEKGSGHTQASRRLGCKFSLEDRDSRIDSSKTES